MSTHTIAPPDARALDALSTLRHDALVAPHGWLPPFRAEMVHSALVRAQVLRAPDVAFDILCSAQWKTEIGFHVAADEIVTMLSMAGQLYTLDEDPMVVEA